MRVLFSFSVTKFKIRIQVACLYLSMIAILFYLNLVCQRKKLIENHKVNFSSVCFLHKHICSMMSGWIDIIIICIQKKDFYVILFVICRFKWFSMCVFIDFRCKYHLNNTNTAVVSSVSVGRVFVPSTSCHINIIERKRQNLSNFLLNVSIWSANL